MSGPSYTCVVCGQWPRDLQHFTNRKHMPNNFAEMSLEAWRPTKNTLHLCCQIVGKIRLAMHPRLNHWWHASLYVSPRGLTTRTIPYKDGNFEIESHMALLMYDDVRRLPDPRRVVSEFLESAYQAGAKRAGWDVESFRLKT